MAEHTPGPWTAFYKHKYQEWHVSVPMQSGGMLLGLFPDGVPTENPEADAHLIAAAPELLAALEKIERQARMNQLTAHVRCSMVLDVARAALAKARGES
jgi:hypothetical protein